MHEPLVARVAARYLIAEGYFRVGDVVLFGKYKNKRGKVVAFGTDKWGNPTIEIEPIPKGRKQNKVFGLYKVWRADVKEKALAEQAAQAAAGGTPTAAQPLDDDEDEDDEEDAVKTASLSWKRFPGGVANITRTPGGGPYAKTEDGRFMIYVNRYLSGPPGDRSYSYHYSAVDYGIPSGGQRFTPIHVEPGREYSSNVTKVMAAVEKWALEHPAAQA